MTKLELLPGEKIIIQGEVSYRRPEALRGEGGIGYLTNMRIVHHKRDIWTYVLGGLAFLFRGDLNFQVKLENISLVSIKKFGIGNLKQSLCFEVDTGKEYEFRCPVREWFESLKYTLDEHYDSKLVEVEENQWVVQKWKDEEEKEG